MKFIRFICLLIFFYPAVILAQSNGQYIKSQKNDSISIITEYGTPIRGYTYDHRDTALNGKITAINEYKYGKRNGRRIQFFKYPDDTASVEYYQNDTLNGTAWYNHKNGKRWSYAQYSHGRLLTEIEYYDEEGKLIDNKIKFHESDQLYHNGTIICKGHFAIYGHSGLANQKVRADIYFTNGKIDSLNTYEWAYWGKSMEVLRNYHDSTRIYKTYSPNGKTHYYTSSKIMGVSEPKLYNDGDQILVADRDELVFDGPYITYHYGTSVISEEGLFSNGKAIGEWNYYDAEGNLIKKTINGKAVQLLPPDTIHIHRHVFGIPYFKCRKIWFPESGSFSYSVVTKQDEKISNDSNYYFKVHGIGKRLILEGNKTKYGVLHGEVKFYYRSGKLKATEYYIAAGDSAENDSNCLYNFDGTYPWGTWNYYRRNGSVKKTIVYSNEKQADNTICKIETRTYYSRKGKIKSFEKLKIYCTDN